MKELNKFYDEAVFKEAEESSARNSVLSKSLAIEKYLSIYLARILDINNHLDSKSFGNTSSALSFNQKTLLISDLKYLDKDDKLKLLSFAEIRNNFAHNSDCLTFKDAFTVDLKNRIKKFYPALKSDVAVESDYEGAVIFLFNEIENIFNNLKDKIYNDKSMDYLFESLNFLHNTTLDIIRKNPDKFDLSALDSIISEVSALMSKKFNTGKETFRTDLIVPEPKYLRED